MFLEKLKEFPKDKTLINIIRVTLIPFVLLTAVYIINEYLFENQTGYGLFNFELAWTPEAVNQIFSAWGDSLIKEQIFMHYLDYIYIPVYVLFAGGLVLFVSRRLQGKLQKIGLIIAPTIILAGFCDALENINLLLILDKQTHFSLYGFFFTSLFTTTKIAILSVATIFLLVVMILRITKKVKLKSV